MYFILPYILFFSNMLLLLYLLQIQTAQGRMGNTVPPSASDQRQVGLVFASTHELYSTCL